jgi:hypothetical protein
MGIMSLISQARRFFALHDWTGMEDLNLACEGLLEAIAEEAAARSTVIGWAQFAGASVWREGHPLDVERLRRLERAEERLAAFPAIPPVVAPW